MDLNEILNYDFTFAGISVSLGSMIVAALLLGGLAFLDRKVMRKWLPLYFQREDVQDSERRRTRILVQLCFLLLAVIIVMLTTGLDYRLYLSKAIVPEGEEDTAELESAARRGIWISTVLFAVLLFLFARLLDWIISHILNRNFLKRREAIQKIAINFDQPRLVRPARRLVQPVVYVLALLFLTYVFNLDTTLETFSIGSGEDARTISIAVTNIISAILILLIARLFNWIFTELVLFPYYQRKEINIGSQYAINQLFKYFLYVFAILIALQSMNINLTILLGGAAALLVGIGLGLQQTFNDLISGIILLSERSVEVGDVLDLSGVVGTVRRIGLRTSLVETRDNMTIIVPNSKLIGDIITNWSHDEDKARFRVKVGVAYGSDTALVKKLLLQVAQEHPKAMKRPAPFVRFIDFGDSSLDFELYFWSKEFMRIEDVKSDMRFEVDRLFRENNITIPFPQRDVWFRNSQG
jgi:small-conductance mechanosensitive channel